VLITAAAALLGGAIAGGASVAITFVNQNGETHRVERRLDEEARGAARVLYGRFKVSFAMSEATLDRHSFVNLPRTIFVSPISSADLELISGRLSTTEFERLEPALISQAFLLTLFDKERGKRLLPGDRATVREFRDDMRGGLHALVGVADLSAPSSSANDHGSGT
jgi:hypothetical protein